MPSGFLKAGTRTCNECLIDLVGLRVNRILCDKCERCHVEGCPRPSTAGWCPMHKARVRKGNQAGPKNRVAYTKRRRRCVGCGMFVWTNTNGKVSCGNCKARGRKNSSLRRSFGISLQDYEKMQQIQDGVCAICGRSPHSQNLSVDHDHRTNAIRGLLCQSCNKYILGASKDSVDTLMAAVRYLTSPPAAPLGLIATGLSTDPAHNTWKKKRTK